MRKFVLLALVLLGCGRSSLHEGSTNNRNFNVEFLFEFEGCKVYRFDDYRTVHYVNCKGSAETQTQHSCGKNCSFQKTVVTDQE